MDNRWTSQLKRSFKVTTSYGMTIILLLVFAMPVMGLAKDNTPAVMAVFSFVMFLLMFPAIYVDMRDVAIKEKRPQYNINPPATKGFMYGIIGIIPIIILEITAMLIKVPDGLKVLVRRVYQGINGPLYWLSKLLGNGPVHYIATLLVVVVIAGLGYYAGHKGFYIAAFIRTKLGIKPKVRKPMQNKQPSWPFKR